MSLLILQKKGREPERVAALNKQSSGLFVAGESLRGSESQLVCKAQSAEADGESLMVHQTKESIVRYSLWFFVDKGLYPEKQSSHTSTG